MKIQRNDHVSKENFVYRYRLRKEHLADLFVASDAYVAAEEDGIVQTEATLVRPRSPWWVGSGVLRRRVGTTRQPTGGHRRQDGPAAYLAVAQRSPARVNIHVTTAADQTNDPEMAHDTPNAGLSDRSSGHPRRLWTSANFTRRDSTKSNTS